MCIRDSVKVNIEVDNTIEDDNIYPVTATISSMITDEKDKREEPLLPGVKLSVVCTAVNLDAAWPAELILEVPEDDTGNTVEVTYLLNLDEYHKKRFHISYTLQDIITFGHEIFANANIAVLYSDLEIIVGLFTS